MVANYGFTRMGTLDLKDLIYQKIGQERAEKYFNLLKRLFSLQLRKIEFDKACIRTIGRENICLHNRLIKSILKNSCLAKVPPPKIRKNDGVLSVKVANGYQRSCLQSLYGDGFPKSPRKSRSPVHRDCKFRDRPSPLGLLGKSPSITCEEGAPSVQEQQSATELLSLGSRPPVEVASVEDGEEVEQIAGSPIIQSRSPVTAPFGIPMNGNGTRKGLRSGCVSADIRPPSCQSSGELPDTRSLRSLLEKRLGVEGVGITLDCASLLNSSLDVFLKSLIGPTLQMAGSQCGENIRHPNAQRMPVLNGVLPLLYPQRSLKPTCGSMLDFRVAMELNPRVLGEAWPLQLEKICMRTFEE